MSIKTSNYQPGTKYWTTLQTIRPDCPSIAENPGFADLLKYWQYFGNMMLI